MGKLSRVLALLCCFLLAAGVFSLPARAEVITLSVAFHGVTEHADGTETVTRLEGSFRVFQNGQEIGTLKANREALTLFSLDPIRLEAVPETMPVGWDLSGAHASVTPQASGMLTVPISVRAAAAVREDEAEPESTPEPEMTEAEPDPTGDREERTETPAPTPTRAPRAETRVVLTPAPTPELRMTAVPTAVPTPEPELPASLSAAGGGVIRALVFEDKNYNGEQGAYEEGLQGIRVYLLPEEGEEALAATRTNGDGLAEFSGLPAGKYRIRAFLPEGWGFTQPGKFVSLASSCMETTVEGEATSPLIAVSAGQAAERGIAAYEMIHVSGFCWLENVADGVRRSGEAMVPGVRITMRGEKNGLFYETTSREDGTWYIDRVRPGFYLLTAYVPDGMMFTYYSRTGGDNRSIFTTEGATKATRRLDTNDKQSKENQNIGFMWGGSVSGMCFLDANYNGLFDEGEKPMSGVKVTAIKQLQDEEIAVTYSGEDGTYRLAGLRGNTYKIRAVLPDDGADFTKVVSDPAGNHFQARVGRRENFWNDFVLDDAGSRTVNVGVIYPATLTGTVYLDDDFSGTLNGSENTVSGFLVSLVDARGQTVASDRTNVRGLYSFEELTPGDYSLRVTALNGYAFTRPGAGSVILNRTGGEGYSESFPIALGEKKTGMDMGMIRPARVDGQVFADANDNGRMDSAERGLAGTVVNLISEEGENAFSVEIRSDGAFTFDAVMPGAYVLEYRLPERAVFAEITGGGNAIGSGAEAAEDGRMTARSERFELRAGSAVTAPLCGGLTLGRIEGTAFLDPEGNGLCTGESRRLAGVTVELEPTRGDLALAAVTTGEDGSFLLDSLRPDAYRLTVTLPEGLVLSRTDALTLPLKPGSPRQELALDIAMGDTWTGQAIGAVTPAAVSGVLWLDENNDGFRQAEEKTPRDYEVTLTDERNGRIYETLRTDDMGTFRATDLIPGSYTVSMALTENMSGAREGDTTFLQEGNRLLMKSLALKEGEVRTDLALGLVEYTVISGQVWIDRGSGPEGLTGAVMTLKDAEGETVQSVTTGLYGGYEFNRLMPGTYRIEGDMPAGCVVVEQEDDRLIGDVRSVLTEADGRHGSSGPIEVRMGEHRTDMDAGCVLPGRLGDLCWLDLNGDGLQDYNEPGLAGVRIELVRDGRTVAETVSDAYGFYRFEEIYPAVYTLRVTPPAEVRPTEARTDLPMIVSALLPTDAEKCETGEIRVQSDRANYNADLGFVCRREGVLPAGIGQGATQNWTGFADSEN